MYLGQLAYLQDVQGSMPKGLILTDLLYWFFTSAQSQMKWIQEFFEYFAFFLDWIFCIFLFSLQKIESEYSGDMKNNCDQTPCNNHLFPFLIYLRDCMSNQNTNWLSGWEGIWYSVSPEIGQKSEKDTRILLWNESLPSDTQRWLNGEYQVQSRENAVCCSGEFTLVCFASKSHKILIFIGLCFLMGFHLLMCLWPHLNTRVLSSQRTGISGEYRLRMDSLRWQLL